MNAETQNKIAGNVIIALIAGLILGFIAGSAWAGHKTASTNDMMYDTSSGSSTAMTASSTGDSMDGMNMNGSSTSVTTNSNSSQVTVGDQKAGFSYTLPSTNLSQAGWIAVRDNYSDKPNYILGAAWVPAGAQTNVVIRLSRATVVGNSYQITLYGDTGNHVFNYESSNIIKINGSEVAATFTATK